MITIQKIKSPEDIHGLGWGRGNFILMVDRNEERSPGIIISSQGARDWLVNQHFVVWGRTGQHKLRATIKYFLEFLPKTAELYLLHIEIPTK